MRIQKTTLGLMSLIGLGSLIVGNSEASNTQYDRAGIVDLARPTQLYSQSGITLIPVTNADGSDIRLSLTDKRMQSVYVDAQGEERRIIDDDDLARYLVEPVLKDASTIQAGSRTLYVPSSSSWDGIFPVQQTRDEIFMNRYVPVLRVSSPDRSRRVDLIHAGDPGIVTHLMYWESNDEGEETLVRTEDLGTVESVERQRTISRYDKDQFLVNAFE